MPLPSLPAHAAAEELEQRQLEEEAAAIEADAAAAAAAWRAREEDAARMAARAWTAHKSPDGQVGFGCGSSRGILAVCSLALQLSWRAWRALGCLCCNR